VADLLALLLTWAALWSGELPLARADATRFVMAQTSLGPNETISIQWGYLTRDCDSPIFSPETTTSDIYMVRRGSAVANADLKRLDPRGTPTTISSSFGNWAIYGEILGETAPLGPIGSGVWDVVEDTCQDGFFDGTDTVLTEAFTVSDPNNLIANGDFEEPPVSNGNFDTYYPGQSFGNWTVESGSIDQVYGAHFQPADGNQSVDLSGWEPGALYQDVPTQSGTCYQLAFALAGNPVCGAGPRQMEVWWGATRLDTLTFDTTGQSTTAMGWENHQYSVVASGASTRLRFNGLTPGYCGAAIDTVSLTPCYVLTFNASGRITSDNAPLPGVTISASNGLTTTTNASGVYTLTNLITGTYTLTPSLSGYTFAPVTRTVGVPPDAAGQDFEKLSQQPPNDIHIYLPLVIK
jgi:choice-of-anchor C domain-containing protein